MKYCYKYYLQNSWELLTYLQNIYVYKTLYRIRKGPPKWVDLILNQRKAIHSVTVYF